MLMRQTLPFASIGVSPGAIQRSMPRPGRYTASTRAFGRSISVSVVHADPAIAELALGEALQAALGVDRLASIERADSALSRLNRDGMLVAPDPRLLAMLGHAHWLARLTKGAFDVTVAPLLRAPDARARTGWRQLAFDEEAVRLAQDGMAVTLDGLAPGFAADQAMAALRRHGIDHARVDTGALAVCGCDEDGRPWRHELPDPREAGRRIATVVLGGRSFATSWEHEMRQHIIDPASGAAPSDLAGTAVLAPTAVMADALSTAFLVMGAVRAHALAASLEGIELMTINRRDVVWKSRGFAAASKSI
ncbi:MAG: FAD:protein FMN transferase [Pseudomonadota bacterium]